MARNAQLQGPYTAWTPFRPVRSGHEEGAEKEQRKAGRVRRQAAGREVHRPDTYRHEEKVFRMSWSVYHLGETKIKQLEGPHEGF